MKNLPEDRKRHFKISNHTYKQDILFCFNMTNKEALKVLKRLHNGLNERDEKYILDDRGNNDDSTQGTMYPLDRGFLVTLKWYKNSFRKNICTATHEIVHVAHYILRRVRIPLEENTEEAYTYLIEDLLKQFLYKLY